MMEHSFERVTDMTWAYGILLQGGADESKFRRVFNLSLKGTHVLDFREEVVADGEAKRVKIVVWLRPLDLAEIRSRSDDFASLSMMELRELVDRHAITLKPVDGRPNAGDDKVAMIDALRAYKPPKPVASKPPPQPVALVIPAEIAAMDMPNALTKAAMLGVSTKDNKGKQVDLPTLQKRIASKMAQTEKETVDATN